MTGRTARRTLAGLLCLLAACAHRGQPGGPSVVGDITIEGNEALSDGDLIGRLVLTESGVRPFGDPFEFREDLLRADSKRIERVYAANGYFQTRVENVRVQTKDGRTNITFVVQEGPPAKVDSIEITGLEQVADRKEILSSPPLSEGDVFTEQKYEQFKAQLARRLEAHGYAQAEVNGQVVVDRSVPAATVNLDVLPGRQYRISRVHVFGAQNVSRSRIAEATLLEEGELFTPDALAEAQLRVYQLGVFSLVRLAPGAFDERSGTVPVVVEVTEAPFIHVEAGGGLEVNPRTRDSVGVRARWTHRNIARGLQKLSASGSLGYAWVPGVVAFARDEGTRRGLIGSAGLEFTQPRVARSPVDLVAGIDYAKDVTQAFGFQQLGARVSAPIKPTGFRALTVAPGLRFSYYFKISGDELSGTDTLSTAGCGPPEAGIAIPTSCRLFAAELLVNLDLRDDPINTRKGFFASVSVARAFTPISEFKYWRVSPDLRGYVPLSRTLTLATHLRYGLLEDVGDSPGDRRPPGVARFFAGGANSVRGVGSQQLGPAKAVVIDNPDADEPGEPPYLAGAPVPLGGDRLIEGSIELRWQTPSPNWSTAVFFDAGALTLGVPGLLTLDAENLVTAVGAGVRWRSPVGPIRLDLGWRLRGRTRQAREVDVRVKDKALYEQRSGAGASTDPTLYSMSTDCGDTSPSWFCYEEGLFKGLQLWITIGEAF